MPRRNDLESICLIGSGPIVIGQACEFDYAGCQALKVLREEGYRTIVVNSNPATIMTDPGFADAHLPRAARPRGRRRRCSAASGPTRCCRRWAARPRSTSRASSHDAGVLAELGIELIGAGVDAIARAEDRRALQAGRRVVRARGRRTRRSSPTSTQLEGLPLPAVVRPGLHARRPRRRLRRDARPSCAARSSSGCATSPIGQVLVEESLRGWDEFELEVVRDRADNVVIVCSIENLDPMGVHTGDSVTVAPQMTLSDEAYQELRDARDRGHPRGRRRHGRLEHPVRARPARPASCA